MKSFIVCLFVFGAVLACVNSLELVDADISAEATTIRNEITQTETDVAKPTSPAKKSPCESCSDEATGCSVHEVTSDDEKTINSEVKCLKGITVLSQSTSSRPNPYEGLMFERTYIETHFSSSADLGDDLDK